MGLSAGLAPGPLLTLVISETLQHGLKAGIQVAFAPLITDLPIIVFTLFVLSKLAHFHTILGAISIAGGLFILWMGYENIRTTGYRITLQKAEPESFKKGALVNVLNPHPYLFWFSVGAPIMTKAINQSTSALFVFVLSFYTCLVGSKILLAVIVGKSKSFLSGNVYIYTMRFLGLILFVLAFALFYDGLKLVGWITRG